MSKTRNVYDLKERGQFTVYYFVTVTLFWYCRIYWSPVLMIKYLYLHLMELRFITQVMFILYFVGINGFNVIFAWTLARRLYEFLYTDKYTEKRRSKSY